MEAVAAKGAAVQELNHDIRDRGRMGGDGCWGLLLSERTLAGLRGLLPNVGSRGWDLLGKGTWRHSPASSFYKWGAEAQINEGTCPRTHSKLVAEPGSAFGARNVPLGHLSSL